MLLCLSSLWVMPSNIVNLCQSDNTDTKMTQNHVFNYIFVDVFEAGLAVAITQPENEDFFVDASTSFDIQVEASEATQVQVFIDGGLDYTTTDLSFTHSIISEASGSHIIKVVATDGTDNVEDIKTYIVREDI